MSCVDKVSFENLLTSLKENAKTKDSPINVFIDDTFFNKAKQVLAKEQVEATPWELSTVKRKGWTLKNDVLIDKNNKEVVPFSKLHNVLTTAHVRIAHRGRDKTIQWIKDNYSEISQSVISSFVTLCKIHAQQKSVTDRVKVVDKPMISNSFLEIIEIDLMDFTALQCKCTTPHKWAINNIDHHTKFLYVQPMTAKRADETLQNLQTFCYLYGYPKKIITDNGLEFKNALMTNFCKKKQHQAMSRLPTNTNHPRPC